MVSFQLNLERGLNTPNFSFLQLYIIQPMEFGSIFFNWNLIFGSYFTKIGKTFRILFIPEEKVSASLHRHRRRGRGARTPSPRLEVNRADLEHIRVNLKYSGKPENENFFSEDLFYFDNTPYIWKYFVLNIRKNSSWPPPNSQKRTVLLSYGYTSLAIKLEIQ